MMNPALCDQFTGDLNPNNLTNQQKTWWRLSEMEIKTEDKWSSKILVTEFVVLAVDGAVIGIFVFFPTEASPIIAATMQE